MALPALGALGVLVICLLTLRGGCERCPTVQESFCHCCGCPVGWHMTGTAQCVPSGLPGVLYLQHYTGAQDPSVPGAGAPAPGDTVPGEMADEGPLQPSPRQQAAPAAPAAHPAQQFLK